MSKLKQEAVRRTMSIMSQATGTKYKESDLTVSADGYDFEIIFPVDGIEMTVYVFMADGAGITGINYRQVIKNSSGSSLGIAVNANDNSTLSRTLFNKNSESEIIVAALDEIIEVKKSLTLLKKGIKKSTLDLIIKAFENSNQDSPLDFNLEIEDLASQFHLDFDYAEIHIDFDQNIIDWIYPRKKETKITDSSLAKVANMIMAL